jgi:chemotaxis protein CheD
VVKIVVNVSDARSSRDPADQLVTYALGSCIGVMLYDQHAGVAGLLHFQLPSATEHPDRAKENPTMFADSGMSHVVSQMQELGAQKPRMRVRLAGAAEMLNDTKFFNIGRRNHATIRKILWKHGMMIDGEDCGGSEARTVSMDVADGTVTVKMSGKTVTL